MFVRTGTGVPIGASITDEELSAAVETCSAGGETVVVASLVSRHFDFLDGLRHPAKGWTGAASVRRFHTAWAGTSMICTISSASVNEIATCFRRATGFHTH